MAHPEDNGRVLSDVDDIRTHERNAGRAEQAAADAAEIGDLLERVQGLTEAVANRDAEIRRLEAEKTAHMALDAPAGHRVVTDPEPAVCPPGTDRAGQEIPDGETEAWCTITDPEPATWQLPARNVDIIQQQYAAPSTYARQVAQAVANFPRLLGALGPRIPHRDLATDFDDLDAWKHIADDNGLRIRPRIMMGGYTPDPVKNAMSAGFKFTGDGEVMSGVPIPRPTNGAGQFNTVFEEEYGRFLDRLFDWCTTNDVDQVNLCWYGMAYSEVYFGKALHSDRAGWLAGHKRLIDIAADAQPAGVTVGWGLSGHGPFFTPATDDMGMALARYMKAKMPEPDRVLGQGNGWGENGVWGQSSATTERQMDHYLTDTGIVPAVQAIQPWGQNRNFPQYTAAQAARAFANVARVGGRNVEFYLPTLATDTAGVWRPHIQNYLEEN